LRPYRLACIVVYLVRHAWQCAQPSLSEYGLVYPYLVMSMYG